jgi:16S rRNA processing protein RimM
VSAKKPSSSEAPGKRVCLGAFAGAHGVRGEAKVKTFTEAPGNIAAYGPVESEDGKRRFTLKFVRALKEDLALVSAPEIESREDAAALAGTRLYVAREALPPHAEDEFYIEDVVGLTAFDEDGAEIGKVVAVYNFGAGDLIEIKRASGEALVIPFATESILVLDVASGRLTLAESAMASDS